MKLRFTTTSRKLLVLIMISTIILAFLPVQNLLKAVQSSTAIWQAINWVFLTPQLQRGVPILVSHTLPFQPSEVIASASATGSNPNPNQEYRLFPHEKKFKEQDEIQIQKLFSAVVVESEESQRDQTQVNHKIDVGNNEEEGENHDDDKDDDDDNNTDAVHSGKSSNYQAKNPYIKPLLFCPYSFNEKTQHFRISNTELHRIEFTNPGQNDRYFNPTFLVLPESNSPGRRHRRRHYPDQDEGGKDKENLSNAGHSYSYEYLIFARLVTPGLHQETHYCPAVTDRITQDLQCVLPPRRLHLPPTPAYKCEGRWASFADIPGFHDPRVFWSGMGQPLMIVNSASAMAPNGCVGLWIVDLRAVSEDIEAWLDEEADSETSATHVDAQEPDGGMLDDMEFRVKPKMLYPHLTEITKNPPSTRNAIEKNWVLFFPQEDQALVMYDVIGQGQGWVHEKEKSGNDEINDDDLPAEASIRMTSLVIDPNTTRNALYLSTSTPAGAGKKSGGWNSSNGPPHSAVPRPGLNVSWSNEAKVILRQEEKTSRRMSPGLPTLKPARTLAKLLGNGATTPNLTSRHESPCFNQTHVHDKLGNIGNWHQGSNSLRVVLCRHPKSKAQSLPMVETCTLMAENELLLVNEGRVVHIMVLHRKFSNSLKLPMRYERYLIVWEARQPFKLLGVTKYPLLFEGERARPWSKKQNGLFTESNRSSEMDAHKMREQEKWQDVYFSYTPSLAWASRSRPGTLSGDQQTREMNLGTAYLDDEIIVGIGLDDKQQGFVKVKAFNLLSCLRLCPDFAED